MPTVVITGANGFVGSYLVTFFIEKGWNVKALVHHMPQLPIAGVDYQKFDLNNVTGEGKFPEGDYLIHCAYAKDSFEQNTTGTSKMLKLSRSLIKKHIFISSISAAENGKSIYVRQKWACEKLFNKPNDLIIRPGLVLGNGGLFGQMKTYLQKKNLIPLIDGGKQPLQIVYIHDLAEAIFSCIHKDLSGTLTIASPEKILYRDFYSMLAVALNRLPTYMRVYYWQLYFLLSITESLGLKLAVSRENLRGLKQLKYIDTTEDLKKIGMTLKTCREALSLIK